MGASTQNSASVGAAIADRTGLRRGHRKSAVAGQLGVPPQTVSKWRGRFVRLRLEDLSDAPRAGAPRTIDDARVDAVIAKTPESQPRNATHWSTRTMSNEMGLPQTAVSRIWRAFGLQPHRQDTFKLSTDPHFVAKTRDIVGLYLDPPTKAIEVLGSINGIFAQEQEYSPALPRPLTSQNRQANVIHHP